jgi:flagellar biosynthetic protein FliQ
MNETTILEIGREALLVTLKTSGPLMVIGMVVGCAVALLQALTTIQEMTLTFVPKIVAMFFAVVLLLPFMMASLVDFSQELYGRIATGG